MPVSRSETLARSIFSQRGIEVIQYRWTNARCSVPGPVQSTIQQPRPAIESVAKGYSAGRCRTGAKSCGQIDRPVIEGLAANGLLTGAQDGIDCRLQRLVHVVGIINPVRIYIFAFRRPLDD